MGRQTDVRRDGWFRPGAALRARGEALEPALLSYAAIRRWAESHLRSRLRSSGPSRAARQALIDDALQHLFESLVRGKSRSFEGGDVPAFLAWCKRVIDNFVTSELRRQARPALSEAPTRALDPACAVETRQLVGKLVLLLRAQVEQSAQQKHVQGRLALLDEFLQLSLTAAVPRENSAQSSRHYQRKCRGRQLAHRAWAELRINPSARSELHEIAHALGLEHGPGPTPGALPSARTCPTPAPGAHDQKRDVKL